VNGEDYTSIGLLLRKIDNGNVTALPSKQNRNGPANSAVAARDECLVALQFTGLE
jgi:hypothetical protein